VEAPSHRSWQTLAEASLPLVRAHGLAVVRGRCPGAGAPEGETEAIIDAFAAAGLRTTTTHFGRIEDLRTDNATNENNDQLGYTDAGIELHSDQPFLERPPRYQLLQSVRRATRGGENFFVDAHAAAELLGSLDAPALELLLSTPVRFHRRQKSFEKVLEGPLLTLAPRFLVRLSYFTLAPLRLDFARTEAFYRAHDQFVSIVRDRPHQRRVALEEGEWVLYDNHRTLHARTGFEGARWARGVYFDPVDERSP
jgi:gamma-butyrobetaine dioxygenase/trimethyllysine dioxygenase